MKFSILRFWRQRERTTINLLFSIFTSTSFLPVTWKQEGTIANYTRFSIISSRYACKMCSKYPGTGQFGKYHNTLCLSPQILHKHCFCFLLGTLYVPRETGNNAYAKVWGTNKEYYGIFRSGLLTRGMIRIQNWKFVFKCSRGPHNSKTGQFMSWKGRGRLWNVQ